MPGTADLPAAEHAKRAYGALSTLLERAVKFGIHIGAMGDPLDEMRKLWKFADAWEPDRALAPLVLAGCGTISACPRPAGRSRSLT